MSIVKIGDKKVRIGGDGYKPTQEEVEEIAIKIGVVGREDVSKTSNAEVGPAEKVESKQNKPGVGGALSAGIGLIGSAALRSIKEGPTSFEGLTGGIGQQFVQNVKRESLDRLLPSQQFDVRQMNLDDLAKSSFKEALVQATYPGNILPGSPVRQAVSSAKVPGVQFGGIKAITKEALDMSKEYTNVQNNFTKRYDAMFSRSGNKFVPNEYKAQISSAIDGVVRKMSPENPLTNYLIKIKDRLSGISGPELHALKQELFYRGKPAKGTQSHMMGEIYDVVSNALSSKKMYGREYNDLSFDYSLWRRKEANYLDDVLFNKHDDVSPRGALVGTTGLDRQLELAIKRFSTRTGKDYLKKLKQLKRGRVLTNIVERYSPPVIAGAGGVGVGYGVGRGVSRLLE